MISGDLPTIGIFQRGTPEWEDFWINYIGGCFYHGNSVIVSFDYESRKLYAGLTDIYFFQKDFPQKKYEKQIDALIWRLKNMEGWYGSNFLVQNNKGEPYVSGDTFLTCITVLISEDIKSIRMAS